MLADLANGAPPTGDGASLTERETRALTLAASGLSNKQVAIELRLSESTASDVIRGAMAKLGARSRLELPRRFASSIPRWPSGLTAAERAVAELLLEGLGNAAIAARRSTSERTVVNQVAAIFKKARVSSRLELAARVFAR